MSSGETASVADPGVKIDISRVNRLKMVVKRVAGLVFPRSPRLVTLHLFAELRKWGKERDVKTVGQRKLDIDEYVQQQIIGDQQITYLEFGVHKANSLKYWCKLNSHEQSRFVGFDSFEGLPIAWEKFVGAMDEKEFDLEGRMPLVDDSRVSLVKGWFQDTLDDFLASFEPSGQLVVNLDADLFESGLYVLTRMDHWLKPGTIVFFDDYNSVNNDFSALRDYCRSYLREYQVLGAAGPFYTRVAIQITK